MRSRWKRIRYRLEWIGLLLATKLIPLFSRRACYHLAQTAGALLSFSLLVNDEKLPGNRFNISHGPWSTCCGARA
ncbi:MAG: hypothetical protein DMF28_07560 [Verrucomicrobia bacterium]|nr:MAG: hypothetical protein DMF28_07560 [Verrucomicrobiota bacterium]